MAIRKPPDSSDSITSSSRQRSHRAFGQQRRWTLDVDWASELTAEAFIQRHLKSFNGMHSGMLQLQLQLQLQLLFIMPTTVTDMMRSNSAGSCPRNPISSRPHSPHQPPHPNAFRTSAQLDLRHICHDTANSSPLQRPKGQRHHTAVTKTIKGQPFASAPFSSPSHKAPHRSIQRFKTPVSD